MCALTSTSAGVKPDAPPFKIRAALACRDITVHLRNAIREWLGFLEFKIVGVVNAVGFADSVSTGCECPNNAIYGTSRIPRPCYQVRYPQAAWSCF